MKKIITFILVLTTITASFSLLVNALNDYNKKIYEYKELIDRLNTELGVNMCITKENEKQVYQYYRGYSVKEVEAELKSDCVEFINETILYNETQASYAKNYSNSQEISVAVFESENPKSVSENIIQTSSLRYNSTLNLGTKVIGSGDPLVYKYSKVNSVTTTYPSNFTGFHYELSSYTATISSNKKKCTVKIQGSPKNSAGVILTVILYDTKVFYAN